MAAEDLENTIDDIDDRSGRGRAVDLHLNVGAAADPATPWHLATIPDPGSGAFVTAGDPEAPAEDRADLATPLGVDGARYVVEGVLGRGGGGLVYEMHDRHCARKVAIKVLPPEQADDPERRARLVEEARVTASLEHPSILPVYDLDRGADGRLWFAMRRASGSSLQELIDQAIAGTMPERIAAIADRVEIMTRVCDAIAYAHSRGVIHQDIKPANILVGDYGEVVVVDWGTAVRSDVEIDGEGRLMGTPVFMSPEQARRERADQRSDIYCLGATLRYLLTLNLPIGIERPATDFWARKRRGALDELPSGAATTVPAHLLAVAARALDPDPQRRQQSVDALRDDLRSFQRHRDSLALCERAEWVRGDLAIEGDHRGYARLVADFRQALDLWPDNHRAAEGLRAAVLGQARHALANGELALAAEVLDPGEPGHAGLLAEVAAARTMVALRERRTHFARLALAVAVSLLIIGGAWAALDRLRGRAEWRTVFAREFTADAPRLDDLRLAASGQERIPAPSEVGGDGLAPPPGQLLWLDEVNERGDVRVELDATWLERIDALEILLRCERTGMPNSETVPRGLSCAFGAAGGQSSFISTNRSAAAPRSAISVPARFVPGVRYRLAFESRAGRLRLSVDGREILVRDEVLPLGGIRLCQVGVRSRAPLAIARIEVQRLGLPEKTGPLVAGDALLAAGLEGDAHRAYLAIADDFAGSDLAEEALARAFLTACLVPALAEGRKPLLTRLLREHPRTRFRRSCLEADAVERWRSGDHAGALVRAQSLFAEDSGSRIAVVLLDQGLDQVAPADAAALAELLARTPGVGARELSRFTAPTTAQP